MDRNETASPNLHTQPQLDMPSVLVVLTSTNPRGAEIEGLAIANGLRVRGVPTQIAALAPGTATTARLDVTVLGPNVRSPATFRALRRAARPADVVIAANCGA